MEVSLLNIHSVMALEAHTFLTRYSVDVYIEAVSALELIHYAKTFPGLM